MCARVFSAPSRQLESGVGPGNEVECFLIILFVTRFFQPSHNTKREARDFIALNRHKKRRENWINVVYQIFCFYAN